VTVIVLAKSPLPGRAKTRLCPPCDPEQAAQLAEAALIGTLTAVSATPCGRRVLALDGPLGSWLPAGFEVLPQRGHGLAERLAHAFIDVGESALLIGMDTPQVTPARLDAALRTLRIPHVDAVLGPAVDGGWWSIGLRAPNPAVFFGVPMSTAVTCQAQRTRLRDLGLRTVELATVRDVDDIGDAIAVARDAPASRFAETLRAVLPQLAGRDVAVAP
jgi:uncharacterized protein